MKRANVYDLGSEEFGPYRQIALLFKRALERKGVCVHKKGESPQPGTISLRTFTQSQGIHYQQIWQLLRGLSIPLPEKTLLYCKAVGMTNPDEIQLALLLSIKARLPETYQHIFDSVIDALWKNLQVE